MNFEKVRNVLIKILLGTLIATSAVAVFVILMGSVTDIMWRVIWTFAAAIFYLLVLLGILQTVPNIGNTPKARSGLFLVNSTLALVCASYLTSMLSIWGVISDEMPWKLHLAYLVLLLGILYAKPLIDVEGVYAKIKPYIYANYAFIGLTCLLTVITIIAPDDWKLWDGLMGRSIAATIVVNVTLSMVITVLYHLFLQQNPQLRVKSTDRVEYVTDENGNQVSVVIPAPVRRRSAAEVILWALIILFIGIPLLSYMLRMLFGLVD